MGKAAKVLQHKVHEEAQSTCCVVKQASETHKCVGSEVDFGMRQGLKL